LEGEETNKKGNRHSLSLLSGMLLILELGGPGMEEDVSSRPRYKIKKGPSRRSASGPSRKRAEGDGAVRKKNLVYSSIQGPRTRRRKRRDRGKKDPRRNSVGVSRQTEESVFCFSTCCCLGRGKSGWKNSREKSGKNDSSLAMRASEPSQKRAREPCAANI